MSAPGLAKAILSVFLILLLAVNFINIFNTIFRSMGTCGAYTRCLHEMSTPGVNFINILRAAFVPVDPNSVKRY